MTDAALRIGEVSRRAGVSPELLRAWERRYGLLRPTRSSGGLRLYSPADVERVRRMREHLAEGLAAAEAAALVLEGSPSAVTAAQVALPDAMAAELAEALDQFDEPRAEEVLDRLLALVTLDTLLGEVILPYLADLGERWQRGEASVAQEHFASSLLRGRLLGLARGWGAGVGPRALLACLPDERHDLGLIAFGLALRGRGWRIMYLGADTPVATIAEVASRVDPSLVVLAATTTERLLAVVDDVNALAQHHRVAVGGPAAGADGQLDPGVVRLARDPIAEAKALSQ